MTSLLLFLVNPAGLQLNCSDRPLIIRGPSFKAYSLSNRVSKVMTQIFRIHRMIVFKSLSLNCMLLGIVNKQYSTIYWNIRCFLQ